MTNNKIRSTFITLFTGVLLVLIILIVFLGRESEQRITVGVIIPGTTAEEGWNGVQYAGIRDACRELGVNINLKTQVEDTPEACNAAIKELADEQIELIILGSYGYAQSGKEGILTHPEITFYGSDPGFYADNYISYFARMYQGRYLSGIVAGGMTKTNQVGYVAARPTVEVIRGINAFTMGVRHANPDANVYVSWTGEWDDETKEREKANALIDAGVDVITYHQNRATVVDVAEERGVYSIGYMLENAEYSERYLTSVEGNWNVIYRELLKAYLQGRADAGKTYWVGLDEQAVDLMDCSSAVSNEIRKKVVAERKAIIEGKDVFTNTIYDNTGRVRCRQGETMGDSVLLNKMIWLVEGVIVYE